MYYSNYHYWGINLAWWIIWGIFNFWFFAKTQDTTGQRNKKETPFEILKKRLALGQITKDEYQENKKILEG
jgi:putative membrane protein